MNQYLNTEPEELIKSIKNGSLNSQEVIKELIMINLPKAPKPRKTYTRRVDSDGNIIPKRKVKMTREEAKAYFKAYNAGTKAQRDKAYLENKEANALESRRYYRLKKIMELGLQESAR